MPSPNLVSTRDRATQARKVMLLDLGLDHRPPSAARIATPDPYLAPEQLDDRVADGRADIYALGATLYTLLTGDTQPYPGKAPVASRNPDVPEHVSQAIARAMNADPALRFQDVTEFLAALQGLHAPPPPPPPAPEPGGGSAISRYLWPGALVALLLALAGVAGFMMGPGRPGTAPATAPAGLASLAPVPTAAPESGAPAAVPPPATLAPTLAPTLPPTLAPAPPPTLAPTPPPALARENNPCGFAAISDARVVWIAVVAPLTGTDRDKGEAMVRAACLALKNLRDGDALPAGLDVRIAAFDDQGDKVRAGAVVAPEIVADETISCIVGHRGSDASIEALKSYTPSFRLMISPSNSNPKVREGGGFVLAGNDIGQSAAGVSFITDTLGLSGAEPILIISDGTTYADGLKAALERVWQTGAVSTETITPNQADPEILIRNILQKNDPVFNLIYIAASKVEDVVKIAPALRAQYPNVPIMVTDASDSPRVRDLEIASLFISTMAMPADRLGEFGADYEADTGTPLAQIPAYTAETYDATLMCAAAIGRAAADPSPQAVRAAWQANPAINEGYPLSSQTGPYSYDSAGNFRDGGTYFIKDGAGETVAKYKCGEAQGDTCKKRDLPALP
jgi:ABC-type branched-subunit amino acid transport system substrate-binding protein